jgi:hypothetical protein
VVEANRLESELKRLAAGEAVGGVNLELRIAPLGEFSPQLTSIEYSDWLIRDPKAIAITREGVTLGPGNFLVTKRDDYRHAHVTVEVAGEPGTVAFVAQRVTAGPKGWLAATSMIVDADGRIRAGLEGRNFNDSEIGAHRLDFAYGEFFKIDHITNEDGNAFVRVNDQHTTGVGHGNAIPERGAVGIFVKSGSVLIRSLVVTDQ